MFRVRENSCFFIGRCAGLAGSAVILSLCVAASVAFVPWRCSGALTSAEGEFTSIRSYDGNFLVTAPDPSTAAWVAKLAELTRQRVFELLGHTGEWTGAASIVLRTNQRKTPAGEVSLWTISVSKGGFNVVGEGIYPGKRDDAVVLQVVSLCLEQIAGGTRSQKVASPVPIVPVWLSCGVAENLSRAGLPGLREYVADAVSGDKTLPMGDLLSAEDVPLDEIKRELLFKQSGSVVDFLLHRETGGSRLRRAIAECGEGPDFTASLLLAFSQDFNTVAQLEERWKEFAVQQAERAIGGSKMLLSETKAGLDGVLVVRIPSVDGDSLEEKVVTTDLEGLFRHRNKRLVRQIASEKASEVFRLSLKAKPEYGTVLQEYLQALTAIARNNRTGFKKHFSQAERLREKLEHSPDFKIESGEDADTGD